MAQNHNNTIFYSNLTKKIKNDLGELFYEMLSEEVSDQDLKLIINVLNNEKETKNKINNQIKETVKQVVFTTMLLYGDQISDLRKDYEDNKAELLKLLKSIEDKNQESLAEHVDGVYDLYLSIKNNSLWQNIKFKQTKISMRSQINLNNKHNKIQNYYAFLLDKNIIKEKFVFLLLIKKEISKEELMDMCLLEKEYQNETLKFLKDYLKKHFS